MILYIDLCNVVTLIKLVVNEDRNNSNYSHIFLEKCLYQLATQKWHLVLSASFLI